MPVKRFRSHEDARGQKLFKRSGRSLLHIDAGQVFLRVDGPQERCSYRGPLVQEGKLGRIAGPYDCDGGETGTFQLTDFEITRHGLFWY